jgi:tetratricopeptide (TPR) repeat protein
MQCDDRPTVTGDELRAFAALDVAGIVGLGRAEIRAWRTVGRRSLRDGRVAAACDLLGYACYLDVADPISWELLAAALLAAKRPTEAERAAAAALALEPTWQRAALAGLCREVLGDEEEAEQWRKEARQLAADSGLEADELRRRVLGEEREGAP